jgi:hypothetical protein
VITDKVSVKAKGIFTLDDTDTFKMDGLKKIDYSYLEFTGDVADWYVELHLADWLSLGFSDAIMMPGSKLPIFDDYLPLGDIGSDLCAIVKPIKELKIAAGLDTGSVFGGEDKDGIPLLNIGAMYAAKNLSVGASFRNICNSEDGFASGVYVNWNPSRTLFLNGGFAYNDDGSLDGINGNKLSASFIDMDLDNTLICGELVWGFTDNVGYNIYSALNAEYTFTDKFILGACWVGYFDVQEDENKSLKPFNRIDAYCHYVINKTNKVTAGFAMEFDSINNTSKLLFPVTYKYFF